MSATIAGVSAVELVDVWRLQETAGVGTLALVGDARYFRTADEVRAARREILDDRPAATLEVYRMRTTADEARKLVTS